MSKAIVRDGKSYRIRRGVEVEIPPEWVGKTTAKQTINKRQSKRPKKDREPPQTRKAKQAREDRR